LALTLAACISSQASTAIATTFPQPTPLPAIDPSATPTNWATDFGHSRVSVPLTWWVDYTSSQFPRLVPANGVTASCGG
jgi:hypothetical protein